ncbi:hypothetical protein PTSG_01579 [Salpingoeca rosetta]|uniref:Uncharacterized protein n=1 Tax=Salpingoeca rosetta (strain ATCC 50818 / BSB-021) TaxID=946362 RepID=F2TYC8_SALR5|nr:uncharacterized protein PTSG_01579 [Salpingoeca rosetta]EGD78602.1 hypothetical protein PTSG_01579 [Salpingoeca rosetta]|eukprot:XP_004997560.1 hypothetical protein PTSG_01579 [Salpingoeca rosetta]
MDIERKLSHPRFSAWSADAQSMAKELVDASGDAEYYQAVLDKFEQQVRDYGEEQLAEDTAKFRKLLDRLQRECEHTFISTETLHIPDQVYCLLRAYDAAYSR